MLRSLRSRRRPRYGVFLCVVVSGLLLLVWVSLPRSSRIGESSHDVNNYDSLLSDSGNDDAIAIAGEETIDTIDALDVVEDDPEDADDEEEREPLDIENSASGYFFHHVEGVIRRAFSKSSMDEEEGPFMGFDAAEDRSKTAFGSDDVAVEEKVRTKAIQVKGVEDALLLKLVGRRVSPLREGWGDWFDKKGDFLRKDKMLRSNLEGLNPLHNPILQDPDGVGLTGITKPDKIIRNSLLHDLKRLPFPSRKIITILI